MANETLKAGFDKYMAGVEAKLAKIPNVQTLSPTGSTPLSTSKASTMRRILASLVNILTLVVYNLLCIVAVSGPCVCMLVSPLRKNPTTLSLPLG